MIVEATKGWVDGQYEKMMETKEHLSESKKTKSFVKRMLDVELYSYMIGSELYENLHA